MRTDPHRLREYRLPPAPPVPKPIDGPPYDPYAENEGFAVRSKVHLTTGHGGVIIETIGKAVSY